MHFRAGRVGRFAFPASAQAEVATFVGVSLAEAGAMPKRKEMDSEAGLRIELLPCVVGGALAAPVVLPLIEDSGTQCIAINAYENWLAKVVMGQTRGAKDSQGIHVISRFVTELLEAFGGDQVAEAAGEDDAAQAAAKTPPSKQPKGRACLGIESDSDEEEFLKKAPPPAKKGKKASNDFQTLEHNGISVTLKKRTKGRGILVPYDSDAVLKLLSHLKGRIASGEQADVSPSKRKRTQENNDFRGDDDKGRVRWLFARHAWEIRYHDADGKEHRSFHGLMVPRDDFACQKLTTAQFEVARQKLLLRARQKWNEMDASGEERYPEP